MSGEEGAAGARNVSGKVNETFKVVRNSFQRRIEARLVLSHLVVLSSIELSRKTKKQLRSENLFFSRKETDSSRFLNKIFDDA